MSNGGHYRQRLSMITENWRTLALRGLVALLFGLLILLWPGLVLGVLALLFGIYAVADGATVLVPALRAPDRGVRRWLPLTEGVVGVIAGLVAVVWTGLTVSSCFTLSRRGRCSRVSSKYSPRSCYAAK
jgi:uncharacterized membrane protein HdeD (DUF308 family)